MFQKIKQIKKKRRADYYLFQKASAFLKHGIYVITTKKNINPFIWGERSYSSIFSTFINLSKKHGFIQQKKICQSTSVSFEAGCSKEILLFEKYVVGFFKDNGLCSYEQAKNNYVNHIEKLNYPTVSIIGFDDDSKSVIMQRINGNCYCDRKHDLMVISKLFECTLSLPFHIEKGQYFMLQHGDAKRNNIVWIDENRFFFIDLDGVSYKPLYFDILHYCASANMNSNEIIGIFYNHLSFVKKLYGRIGSRFDNDYLDNILYNYAMFYVRLDDCFEDIDFLIQGDLDLFPRTSSLISKRILDK